MIIYWIAALLHAAIFWYWPAPDLWGWPPTARKYIHALLALGGGLIWPFVLLMFLYGLILESDEDLAP